MYFIVYKTTNLVNGKFYIGQHKTLNLDDGYIGSGKLLKRAIEKYGFSNFKREVLFSCSSKEEMCKKECESITQELIESDQCYNLKLGGEGGFDFHNSNSEKQRAKNLLSQLAQRKLMEDPVYRAERGKKISEAMKSSEAVKVAAIKSGLARRGKKRSSGSLSLEHKTKIGLANSKIQSGTGNSQYGTCWITDGFVSVRIKKTEPVPQGWRLGRVIKYNGSLTQLVE